MSELIQSWPEMMESLEAQIRGLTADLKVERDMADATIADLHAERDLRDQEQRASTEAASAELKRLTRERDAALADNAALVVLLTRCHAAMESVACATEWQIDNQDVLARLRRVIAEDARHSGASMLAVVEMARAWERAIVEFQEDPDMATGLDNLGNRHDALMAALDALDGRERGGS